MGVKVLERFMNFSRGPIALQYVTIDVLQSATLTRQHILNVINVRKTRHKTCIKWHTDTTALFNSYKRTGPVSCSIKSV